ncbi:hypothetical protein U1Q18_021458 [Sarracenia purpurea var. burkii]
MDYSQVPVAKRTRLQEVLIFRQYNERKKKKKVENGGNGGSECGNREREYSGRARFDGGGLGWSTDGSGSAAGSGGGEAKGMNVGVEDGVGSVSLEIQKSKKGSKNNHALLVQIDDDSRNNRKNKEGLKRDKNIVTISVDFKKNDKSCRRVKRNKNVVRMGAAAAAAADDDESGDDVQFLRIGRVTEVDRMAEDVVLDSDYHGFEKLSGFCKSENCRHTDGEEVVKMGKERIDVLSTDSEDPEDSDESRSSSEDDNDCTNDQNYEVDNYSSSIKSDNSSPSSNYEDDDDEISVVNSLSLNQQVEEKMVEVGSVGGQGKEGFKRGRGRPRKNVMSRQAISCNGDGKGREENGNCISQEGINEGGGKEKIVECGLKRGRGRPRKSTNLEPLSSCHLGGEGKYGSGHADGEKGDCKEEEWPKSVAERVRLRHSFNSKEAKEKKWKRLGTSSCPFTLTDDEEVDSSCGDEDDIDGHKETSFGNGNDAKRCVGKVSEKGKKGNEDDIDGDEETSFGNGNDAKKCLGKASEKDDEDVIDGDEETSFGNGNDAKKCLGKASEKGDQDDIDGDEETSFGNGNDAKKCLGKASEKGEKVKMNVGRPAKRRRGSADSYALISVDKILADSILEKGDVPLENLVSSRDKVLDEEPTLPLKFCFGDEDSNPPEKSFWDIESDKLFAELEFVLAACEIGSSDSSMVDNEDSISQEIGSDPANCCHRGKHQLVLDEQIGLKCKFCSFVKLEIKHILPSFSKHPWAAPDKKDSIWTDHFDLDDLQFQDTSSLYQSGSKPRFNTKGTVWDFIPGIKNTMYPHQREGFEFIWKNIAGGIDLEELKKKRAFDGGNGCIISHAPGTGKTRLTIVFLQAYMELYRTCRPVIIAPRSMLMTWEEEFKKWKVDIPFHNLNKNEFSGWENEVAVNLLKQVGRHGQNNKNSIRLVKLYSWKMDRSILGISYRLFEKLAGDGFFAVFGGKKGKTQVKVEKFAEGEQVRKMLLELPGLLVLDEGHTPRNDQSLIWKALSRVETRRRIILSGTPFQNNFDELFNTLCLVRPKFSDRILSETRGFSRRRRGRKGKVARGNWVSLTNSIGKDTDDKLDKLRAMIYPFVHVHKGTILKENLPGLRDSMIVLQPTHLQKSLIKAVEGRKNPLDLDYLVSLISVHPSLLLECFLSEEEELSVDTVKLKKLRFDPKAGVKTKFVIELIRLSVALKEKVLIFSQYIDPLTFIRDQLKSSFDWREGKELLYMDGKLDSKHRQCSINLLNDPASEAKVMLASTKACSEGINLVGASRVVLLDVVWNPSVDRQAISRAYRLGQKKVVYIYRLITSGTKEGEKYIRQAEKDRLSQLVFCSEDCEVQNPGISGPAVADDDEILQEMVQHEKMSSMFEKILNQPKESNLIDTFGF